ncbi:MAG: S24 family peptidase [Thermodesulfobacteriota bacterium]|nr:S24 family peptidase [Thermodesulfobacteriota bacterium]
MDVAGDSMEPFICDNDTVLIDQSRRDTPTGKIYAVGIERTVVINR